MTNQTGTCVEKPGHHMQLRALVLTPDRDLVFDMLLLPSLRALVSFCVPPSALLSCLSSRSPSLHPGP